MDNRRFDDLAKHFATNRRSLLKKMVGIGGAAAVARLSVGEAEAARRGYSGPSSPGLTYSARICTLGNPGCCMDCSLLEWTSANTVRNRLAKCVNDDHRGCSVCVDAVVAPIEGECWMV